MKKSVSLFLGVIAGVFVQAQAPTAAEYRSSGQRMIAYQTLPDEQKETVQGRFIRQVWSPGEVRFRKTDKIMQVPLIFDVYSNQLYYLQNGIIMEFVEPVREFRMQLNMEKDSVTFVFRCTYPDIDKNTGETFYEVITDGRFQLLRCKAKTINLYKDKDVPEEQRDFSKELLYAYLPGGKMIQLKKDREFILEHMPEHAEAIRRFMEEKKSKLKTEEALKALFTYLNNQ